MNEKHSLSNSIREIYTRVHQRTYDDVEYENKIQLLHQGMNFFYEYLEDIEKIDELSEAQSIVKEDAKEFLKALQLIEKILENQSEKLELSPFLEIWSKVQSQSTKDLMGVLFNAALKKNTSLHSVEKIDFENETVVSEKFSEFFIYLEKKRQSVKPELQNDKMQLLVEDFVKGFKNLNLDKLIDFNQLESDEKEGLLPKGGTESIRTIFPFFKEAQKKDLQEETKLALGLSVYDQAAYVKQLEKLQDAFLKAVTDNRPDISISEPTSRCILM